MLTLSIYRNLYSFVFFLCVDIFVYAQPSIHSLNTKNGLSNNAITDIIQDSTGYIWIATKQGLNRYDASTFKIYNSDNSPLPTDDITDLLLDVNGDIWISTANGELAVYSQIEDQIKTLDLSSYGSTKGITKVINKSSDEYWLGTEEGLFLYNFKNSECQKLHFIDKKGRAVNPEITDILRIFGYVFWSV